MRIGSVRVTRGTLAPAPPHGAPTFSARLPADDTPDGLFNRYGTEGIRNPRRGARVTGEGKTDRAGEERPSRIGHSPPS